MSILGPTHSTNNFSITLGFIAFGSEGTEERCIELEGCVPVFELCPVAAHPIRASAIRPSVA
jgi:hypothetical protein